MTLREHTIAMLDMRRIAAWRTGRGEFIMAQHATAAMRFHKRKCRAILRGLYSS